MVKNVYFFAQNSVFSSANCPNGKTQEKYALTQENYAKTQSFGHCSASKCQNYGFKKACCKCHIVRDKKTVHFPDASDGKQMLAAPNSEVTQCDLGDRDCQKRRRLPSQQTCCQIGLCHQFVSFLTSSFHVDILYSSYNLSHRIPYY